MRAVRYRPLPSFRRSVVAAEGCGECFRSFRPRQSGVGFVQGSKKRFPGGVLCQQVPDVLQIVDFEPDGIGVGCASVSSDKEGGSRCECFPGLGYFRVNSGEEICRELGCAFAGAQWV